MRCSSGKDRQGPRGARGQRGQVYVPEQNNVTSLVQPKRERTKHRGTVRVSAFPAALPGMWLGDPERSRDSRRVYRCSWKNGNVVNLLLKTPRL